MLSILAYCLSFHALVYQNPAASIGLYVDCGSIYESPATFGATHVLERMAFKSTRNRSHLRVVREVEAIGGSVQSSASREQMGYTYDALKTYLPEMVELLIDCVRNPVFLDWEFNEQVNHRCGVIMHLCETADKWCSHMIFCPMQLQKVKAEISEASKNPQGLLFEAIHSAGFSGALANPLLAPESSIDRLNSSLLEEFVAVCASENFLFCHCILELKLLLVSRSIAFLS